MDVAVQLLVLSYKGGNCISIFALDGNKFGTYGASRGHLYDPASIAIDTCRSILITEVGGHRVSIFNKDGVAIHTLLWILWFC